MPDAAGASGLAIATVTGDGGENGDVIRDEGGEPLGGKAERTGGNDHSLTGENFFPRAGVGYWIGADGHKIESWLRASEATCI